MKTTRPTARFSTAILALLPDAVLARMTAELAAARTLKSANAAMAAALHAISVAAATHKREDSDASAAALASANEAYDVACAAALDTLLAQDELEVLVGKTARAA